MSARRILYLCPEIADPCGGVTKIYRHAEILHQQGFTSYIIHKKLGFRAQWFQHNVPIAYIDELHEPLFTQDQNGVLQRFPPINNQDILVVPELMANDITNELANLDTSFVILNQGAYLTFQAFSLKNAPFQLQELAYLSPYCLKNLLGTIIISQDNYHYLRYAFPDILLYPMRISFNSKLFVYQKKKKKQIAFMPRRNFIDIKQVIYILKERGKLNNWIFYPIDAVNESKVADILKESAIFMSFSYEEGLGIPPMEAMASGCVVIGYHGQGGKEYFKPPHVYPIDQGDILSYAKKVETVALDYEKNPEKYEKQSLDASQFICATYSEQLEQEDLLKTWNMILKKQDQFFSKRFH